MSDVTIGEIVELVGGDYRGPRDRRVSGVAPLADASEQHVSFLSNPKYAELLGTTRAGAVLVAKDLAGENDRWIRVKNPYFAMATVVAKWFAERPMPRGISPLASIDPTARLGRNVGVGPFTSIGAHCTIDDDVSVFGNVTIEPYTTVGAGTIIYPQVSIYYRTSIGKRCIIHSGAVIGSDGYGFATEAGRHHKIPQIGIVRIEDDVEVGAGTTIDRAALGETVIGEGTKIDNLVQIAHNVKVGKHCLLVSQVGIAGSTELGDYVVMAGQAGAAGHLRIGAGSQVMAASAVLNDLPDKARVQGNPAVPWRDFSRREILSRRLPELAQRVKDLENESTEGD
jgi:UDP-3-O-[3-hydroxymyristoyl] glucosamine N-acyltransferase